MKMTELHSLTMQVKEKIEEFKEGYEEVLANLSTEMKLPLTVKPVKVILDMISGHCTMYILRNPKCPACYMNNYIFKLAQVLKSTYGLSTIILKRKNMYVDENNVPETIAVNPKEAAEIIKKAQEDELFSDKYKAHNIKRKTQKELDDEADAKACAYAEKLTAAVKEKLTTTPTMPENTEEDIQSVTISEITFTIEKNGQLCLVF